VLEDILDAVDQVLIMTINPGFGGQKLVPSSIQKVRKMRRLLAEHQRTALIEVDGGVDLNTITELAEAGADVFVAGTSVFKASDPALAIRQLKEQPLSKRSSLMA
jgi:ribulose-phosphate 3-epimerase